MAFDSIMSQGTFSGETVSTGFQYIIAGSTPENITLSAGGQQPLPVANVPEKTIPDVDNNYLTQGKISTDGIVQDTRTNVDTAAVRSIDRLTAPAALVLPSVDSVAAPASVDGAISALNAAGGVKASSPESKIEPNITATASDTAFAGTVNISVKSPAGNSTEYNISAKSGSEVAAEAAGSVCNYIAGAGASGSLSVYGALGGTGNYRIDNTSLRAIDAEKSNIGDTDLCWAATASNMLYWAGWGKNTGSLKVSIEDDLLDYYKKYFTDVAGYIDAGIKWFWTGQYDNAYYSTDAQLKQSGGGGFYSSLPISNYLKIDSTAFTAMSSVDSFLKDGEICGLGVYWLNGGGHAVTCWGFSYNDSLAKSNKNYYTGIWISDSDDNIGMGRLAPDVIRYCPIRWSSGGYIVSYDSRNLGVLRQVIGLKRTFTINDYDPVSGETVQGGIQTVFSGGSAYNNLINSGGSQIVSSGGITSGTNIASSGGQTVSSGGTANATTVNSGGYQTVLSGGAAAGTAVNSGARMNVSSGGTVSGLLTVAGGRVVLENASSVSSLTTLSYVLASAQQNDVLITVNGGTFGSGTTAYTLNIDSTAAGSYILAAGADLSGMNGRSFTITYNYANVNLNVGSSYAFSDGNKLSLSVTRNTNDQLTAVFSTDTQPPTAPAGLGRTVTGKSVAFDWADSTDADSSVKRYEIRVDNNANFSSPEYTASPIASAVTVNSLSDGTYYWSVRARDDAGNYSAWTTGTGFVVDATAPSAPAGLTRSVTGNRVALDWLDARDKTSGVKQYEVQVDNNADFSSPEYTATPAASAANFTGLAENDYFWRVRAQDNSGNYSAWSAGSGFVGDLVGNTINNASPLAAPSISGAVGFGDSADVYKLTMANAGTLTLGLTGLSGNANLFLLNAYGSLLKYSANPGAADEAINNAALLAGTYYVKITPGAGVNGTDYTLTDTIKYFPADKAANDCKTAQDISNLDNWVGFGDPADFYKLTMADAGTLTLGLTGLTGNADMALLSSTGAVLKTSANPGTANESITQNLLAGTYYVKVAAGAGVNEASYTLTRQISYFPGDTYDKAGNTIATAKLIDAPAAQTGWVGFGDNDDFYRFDLAAASQATLQLHDMTGGNANLLLYNAKGRLLQASVKPGALEDVITANLAAGTYYARVNAFSGNIDYKLDFSRKDGYGMLAG